MSGELAIAQATGWARVAALALVACQAPAREEGAPTPTPAPAPVSAEPVTSPAPEARKPRRDGGPPLRADGTLSAGSEQMGTQVNIKAWVDPDRTTRAAEQAIRAAFAEIERIEEIASEWRPHSEVSRVNAAAGGEMLSLSADLYAILARSRELAAVSDGAFDPTFHAVGQLWSFEPGAAPPARAEIEARRPLIDWRAIELDAAGQRGRLARPGMQLGLGAIAKGYAVDRASRVLVDSGFRHHIVEGGGDTYVSGTRGGATWMVGIQDPHGSGTLGALPITDRAVVTSGGYQRYFEHEGRRYAHILDPRTGWPLDEAHSALSVTVVADNATDADGLCTAVAVMGPEAGMAFVESQPGIEAVIVPRAGEPAISSGLRSIFVTAPPGR